MKLITLVVGPLEENCYIAYDEASRDAVITDPGDDGIRIIEAIRAAGLRPLAIVNTHGHWDHVGAVPQLCAAFEIPFYLHPADAEWLEPPLCTLFGQAAVNGLHFDRALAAGETLQLGVLALRVLHTPGHTRGGCVLWYEGANLALTGDTLFKGTVGRTDFPGGSYEEILASVQETMAVLPDDCVVYPGHGPKSSMGWERQHNPYLRYKA